MYKVPMSAPLGGGGPSASSLQGLVMKTGGAVGSGAMEGGLELL